DWNIYFTAGSQPTTVTAFVQPGGVGNACNYAGKAVNDTLSKTIDTSLDATGLKSAWADYQKALYDDLPYFTIANPLELIAHTKSVAGVTMNYTTGPGDPEAIGSIFVKS